MRSVFLSAVCGLGILAAPAVGAARQQQSGLKTATSSPQSAQPSSTTRSTLPPIDGHGNDPEDPSMIVRQAQMVRMQNNERQKRIVDETAKLLKLATELKEDVDKSNKDQMSLEVIRKADEVERLAHDVKIRMRG